MSWINNIAGKAEDLLNKIDHSASVVLSKDVKKKKKATVPIYDEEATFAPLEGNIPNSSPMKEPSPAVAPLISTSTSELLNPSIKEDDRLISYLNDSAIDIDSLKISTDTMTPLMNHSPVNELNIQVDDTTDAAVSVDLVKENELLRNEVRSLNSEISLLMARTKSAERELTLTKSLHSKREGDSLALEEEVTSLKQRLTQLEKENSQLYNENFSLKKSSKDGISDFDIENKLSQFQLEAQRKEEALKGDIASLRIRIGEIEGSWLKEKNDFAEELSEVNGRLAEARQELEDYQAKAQWTLSQKDKLISELRKERGLNENSEVFSLEVQQLREEKEKLLVELEEVREKLSASRRAEVEVERRLEAAREEGRAALRSAQARLAEETARRLAAEEHSAGHAEELVSVREELCRQVGCLKSRLEEREGELTRLRRQLAERALVSAGGSTSRSSAELTAALVQRQELIERMTGEMNQLRLQLDRARMAQGQDVVKRYQNVNVNDTDDAKAQLPRFMRHSALDASVKRAYSAMDRLSRALFMRRHPCTRMLLFSYLVVLHLWLCFVLFSYTPDNH